MSPQRHRPSNDRTRRQLLAAGGAALPLLTAGCLSSLPPLGGNQRYGRLTVPSGGDPAYRRWLPAPTSVESPPDRYSFATVQPTAPRPDAPEEFIARRAYSKANINYFGIGFENYDLLVDSIFGTVIEASFDRTQVTQTITDSGYERTGQYRDYVVFARSDVPRRVAVGDGVVVWTSVQQHDQPKLEAVIDAGAGERPRYHEENARFEQLTTAAGGNAHLLVNTDIHDPTGRPAMLADAFRFDGETAYQVVTYHYENDRVPAESALKQALKEGGYRFTTEAETFDVQIDGSLATVEAQVPFNSNTEIAPEYDLPQVTWGVTQDADATRVTFRHEAGESVSADRLYYDLDRPEDFGELEKQPLWSDSDDDSVSPGAEATVDLSDHLDAEGISLVYSTGGTHFHVLFTVDLRGETDA
ncbi:hypothetical protein [Halobellus limi]|uniref:Uncharacterized protein n=2 Tax=Halobellus limi TaxID=699433 RepID=A0A1H6BUB8_9EURY|nr:hypothetical protein [Halobellus limi]QCC49462.1 hypothetical protein DV707_17205 [Halobellus limi]SEG64298.1 hypothetical protein SAMN04488133_3041 [Halobellus limi]